MRKIVSWVLLGVGAFLLVTAVVASVWAPGQVKRAPIDTDSTTRLAGTAERLDASAGEVVDLDVRAVSITEADSNASDDEIVVYVNTVCLVVDVPDTPDCGEPGTGEDADPNVINIATDVFATDRETGLAVNDPEYLPADAEPHEGLVNKFPFDTEKKDYPFWDGVLDRAVTAQYVGETTIDGLDVYEFNYVVEEEPATVVGDIEGLYSMDKTIWAEPRTGKIVDQEQHDVRTLEDGSPLLDLRLAFTDEQVAADVADAEDSLDSLNLLTRTVPIVGYVAGPLLILVGAGMLLMAAARSRRA
ncbi:DUF3068 domain-containing protein [Nocardioides sp. GCM10027113]|uniref:DUF3068 domain-containing protein n=1 Tax=unclassified Nocardioides TaxID=2615069 RepID=UPI0036213F75